MNRAPRNEHVDAVKGALVLLVIFAHLLETFLKGSALNQAVYSAVYLFHMPLFVFLTGMFSKSAPGERDFRAMAARLVLPLVVFQLLYLAVTYLQHDRLVVPPLRPYWLLWFLLSAVMWKLVLPLFVRLPHPILWATGLALLAGYSRDIGYAFSLSRTFYFLPLFLAGHLWGEQAVRFSARHRPLGVAGFVAAVAVVVTWSLRGLPHEALYGSASYKLMPVIEAHPATGRALLLGLSLVASVGFLALVRTRWRPLAYLGERTLTIYVLHGFPVMGLRALAKKLEIADGWMVMPACAVLAVVVAWALAPLDTWLNRAFGWAVSGTRRL